MEQPINLPSSSNVSRNLQAYSQNKLPQSLLVSADKIAAAISKYGEEYRTLIMERYQKGTSIERAVNTNSPSFHDVTDFFGKDATLFWLRFHIAETFCFLGIYDTASKMQVQQTAELILSHEIYGQLTLSEFLSFLKQFKRGDYGKIYQSLRPNPQEFLLCMQPFWKELAYYRGKKEDKERRERSLRDLHSPDNMSYEEWQEIKTITAMNDIFVEYNRGKR